MKRILFVDDEPHVLAGLQNILRKQRHHWEMVFACGGDAALAELARDRFDVVVSDMRMPGMDGAALLRRVQQEYPHAARIVLSGHSERDAVVRALPVAHQFLGKPCDVDLLKLVIERTCTLQGLLHDHAIREVVGQLDRLPSVPRCYLELTKAVSDPDRSLIDIARIIEGDPAMSAKVLQLVNSAYFGPGNPITSVQRAVVYLGADLIQGLVLSAEVFATLGQSFCRGFSLDALQEHSLVTARLAKRIVVDAPRGEEAFAAAIVHDIGKMILALGCPERYARIIDAARQAQRPLHVVERDEFGVSHAEVGGYLLGVWGLPFSLVETVAYHHAPSRLATGDPNLLAAVHVADALSASTGSSEEEPRDADRLDMGFLDRAGLLKHLPAWKVVAARERFALVAS